MERHSLLQALSLAWIITIAIVASSCRTQYVAIPEVHQRDSAHVKTTTQTTTITIDRTHALEQRGDTIFKTDSVYVEKIHEVEVHDTVTIAQRDSVPYPVEVPVEVQAPVPRIYKVSTALFWLIVLIILLVIIYKIKQKGMP